MNRHSIFDPNLMRVLKEMVDPGVKFNLIWDLLDKCIPFNSISQIYPKLGLYQQKILFSNIYYDFLSKNFDISACVELKVDHFLEKQTHNDNCR